MIPPTYLLRLRRALRRQMLPQLEAAHPRAEDMGQLVR
jgi:hypothetical protein